MQALSFGQKMTAFALLPKQNTPEYLGFYGEVFKKNGKLWFRPEDRRLKVVEVERIKENQ